MKKTCVFAGLLLIIFSIQTALAISTNLKDSYSPGETMIVEISGNILEPITPDSIVFRRGHVYVPFDYDVKKLGDKYYLWSLAPPTENNYTLFINDISTSVSGTVQKVNYEKNFSVSGNLTDYSIRPGFISMDKDFEINVQLNEDFNKDIDINFPAANYAASFTLKPGQNALKFSIKDVIGAQLTNISIGKYSVPAYIKSNRTQTGGNLTNVTNVTNINITNISEVNITQIIENKSYGTITGLESYNCSDITKDKDIPGGLCAANETCSGKILQTLDGACCVNGACVVKEVKTSYAWVGYLIGGIVLIGAVYIWIRYKKTKGEKNPLPKKVAEIEKKYP